MVERITINNEGEFDMELKAKPQLFKSETVQQRKIMEWLVEQGITNDDVAAAQLTGPTMVRLTNPAGQYMDVYCGQDNTVRILDVTEEREADLQQLFWDETNDPETKEWREELTADEAAMVEQWDLQAAKGFSKLASEILERSTPTEQIMVAVESTDDHTDANFHAELIDMHNPDDSWGTVVDRYRLVKIGDTGRIEVLDKDLVFPTKAQAEAVAASIPYARLIDYDTLVHEAGKNLTAKYTLEEIPDSPDLRLRFHGYGKIEGYFSVEARPWQAQIGRIREIAIGNGITEIGRNVLNDYPAVEEITWPGSIKHSDPYALWNCPNLKGISLSGERSGRVNAHDLTSPSILLNVANRYPDLTREQLTQIAEDLRDGASWDEISVYAKPEFSALQMSAIRCARDSGVTPEQIGLIANPQLTPVQMDIIRNSFLWGMGMEEVQRFAKPELTPHQMLDAHLTIREGRPWEPPAASQLSHEDIALQRAADVAEKDFWAAKDYLDRGGDIAELAEWDEVLSLEKEAPETMTVVMVEPNQQARIMELPHTLEAMQKAVGGSMEATYPFEDPVAIIRSKEDKLDGLPPNRALYGEGGDVYDILCGTFFVAGVGTEDFCSLSPDLAQKYMEQFKSPEQFFRISGHIVALKTEQENIGQALDNYLAGQNVSQETAPAPAAEAPTLTMGG